MPDVLSDQVLIASPAVVLELLVHCLKHGSYVPTSSRIESIDANQMNVGVVAVQLRPAPTASR